ncbi:LisH domain-containing protein ARMC9 [Amphibalanus amphitrite]|uniref:LisH domain-containing protein ARMC9 n=1 Tax=Amphibalanus amphitrite TaxID=1232801 RepID=A0A6A4WM58_AMPAM|nr:LisH domain-containing protein ARMC9 [Amphibalanus amphitrite]
MSELSDAEASVNGLVQEYLETAGLDQSAAAFSGECRRLGRPVQPPPPASSDTDSGSQEQSLALFDRGRRSAFFQASSGRMTLLESVTPAPVLQGVQYRRLEFLLNVYFAVYPLRRSRQSGSAAGYMTAFSHGVAEDEDQLVAALEEMMPAVSSADIAAAGLEDDEVKALISQIPQRWPSKLREVPPVLKPYFSPSELLHGRQLRTSLENAVVQSSDCRGDGAIQQHVRKKQRKMKRYHDRTARKPDIKFPEEAGENRLTSLICFLTTPAAAPRLSAWRQPREERLSGLTSFLTAPEAALGPSQWRQATAEWPKSTDYLENKGKQLAGNEELLPFFALPYIPDPSKHPSFRQLFQDEWAESLRSEVSSFVHEMTSGAGSPSRLVQLYLSRDLLARQAHHLLVRSHDRLLETQRHYKRLRRRHLRLQEDYRRLIGVTGELTSALEMSVREGGVDLEATLGACCQIFPQLFSKTIQQHATDQNKSSPELILRQSVARHQADSVLPAAARFPLDLAAVRHHLSEDSGRAKALLLQALRRRVTRSSSRLEVVEEYVDGDLVGLRHVDDYTRHVLSELTPPEPHVVQQSWARLLNCMASFGAGRTYLCGHQPLLDTLLKVLQYQKLDAVTLDMVLATLQKLSLRRAAQSRMIEWGMVEWLVGFLQDHAAIAPYTLEYGCALLMNLCLRTAGRQKCAPHVNSVLKLLTDLLGSSYAQVLPYVNGTLYSLLGQPEIRARATKLGLGQVLEYFMEQGSTDLRRQLEYIMRQYRGEGVDGAASDSEDGDEDIEDTEFLEEDIDGDDPVVAEAGELDGEELLATLALGSGIHRPPPEQASRQAEKEGSESPQLPGTSHSDSVLVTGREDSVSATATLPSSTPVTKSHSDAELARRPAAATERDRLPQIPAAAAASATVRPLPEVTPHRRRKNTSERGAVQRQTSKPPSQVAPLRLLERRPTLDEGKLTRALQGKTGNSGEASNSDSKSRRRETGPVKSPPTSDQSPQVRRRAAGSTSKPPEPQGRTSESAASAPKAPTDSHRQDPENKTSTSAPAAVSRKLAAAAALTSAVTPALAVTLTAGPLPGSEGGTAAQTAPPAPAAGQPAAQPPADGERAPATAAASVSTKESQPAGPQAQTTAGRAGAPSTAPPAPVPVVPPAVTDPLIQRLPVPAVSDYLAAFSSRPRIMRTPPPTANPQESQRDYQRDSVLPPID